jgi:SAM-dependent methyltransferase
VTGPAVPSPGGARRPRGAREIGLRDETAAPVPGRPFRAYLATEVDAHWSASLEELHLVGTRDHWIDSWTREASLDALAPEQLGSSAVIADLGCSSGHLLADLAARRPDAALIGIDAVPDGLARAAVLVPGAFLCHASVTDLPIDDGALDGVLALNLLEHVADDRLALREVARVLRPGGRAVLVVPRGPELYDFYDEALQHERRYAGRELARKSSSAGLRVRDRILLGGVVFPGFWAVKKRNRRRYRDMAAEQGEALVAASIARTQTSRAGAFATAAERRLVRSGVRLPFGVRELLVVERP